jgi:hypothetical protein
MYHWKLDVPGPGGKILAVLVRLQGHPDAHDDASWLVEDGMGNATGMNV